MKQPIKTTEAIWTQRGRLRMRHFPAAISFSRIITSAMASVSSAGLTVLLEFLSLRSSMLTVTQGTDTSVLKHRYRSRIYIDTFMVGMSRRDGLLILVFRNYVVGI